MLRIAVPNKGSLSETAADMLAEAGYAGRRDPKTLHVIDADNDVEFFFLRPKDIATYVGSGAIDVGITGRDLLLDARMPGAREIEALKKRLNEIYVKHTGREYETIHQALERDNFMTADAAKEPAPQLHVNASPVPPSFMPPPLKASAAQSAARLVAEHRGAARCCRRWCAVRCARFLRGTGVDWPHEECSPGRDP